MSLISLRAYLEYIEDRLMRDAYKEVVAQCRHILERYPKHIETYKLLARGLVEQGENLDALDLFQRVLSIDPSDFIAHIGISECYREGNNLDPAIWHLERAFEQVPNNVELQTEIKKLYDQAGRQVPRKIRLTGGALARLYAKGNLYPQAIKELEKAIARDPERLDLQTLMADVLWKSHQEVQAGRVAAEILKRLPHSIDANRILAQLWLKAGKPAEAHPFLERVKELDPYIGYEVEHFGETAPADNITLQMLEFTSEREAQQVGAADWVLDMESMGGVEKKAGVTGTLSEPGAQVTDIFGEGDQESGALPDMSQDVPHTPAWLQTALDAPVAPAGGQDLNLDQILAGDTPAGQQPAAGSIESADPDWLLDALDATGPAAPLSPPAAFESAPDWLGDSTGEMSASAGDPSPDWLMDAINAETPLPAEPAGATNAPAPADDAPDWLQDALAGESAAQSAPGSDEAPDWLLDAISEETPPPASAAAVKPLSDLDTAPDWLQEAVSETPEAQPADDGAPDWLADAIAVSASGNDDDIPTPAEVSDEWLDSVISGAPPIGDEAPAPATLTPEEPERIELPEAPEGWLTQDTGLESPESNVTDAEPEGVPDWLSDAPSVESVKEDVQAISSKQPQEAEELPDWLSADGDEPLEDQEPHSEVKPDSTEEELPEWLKQESPVEASITAADEEAEVVPPFDDPVDDDGETLDIDWDSDDALSWLEDLAAELDPDFERTTESDEDVTEAEAVSEPEITEAVEAPVAETPEPVTGADEEELPDWLKEEAVPEASAESEAEPIAVAEDEEDEELPDWLVADSPATAVVSEAEADPGGDELDWLREPSEATEPADESDLPDWMKDETSAPVEEEKAAEPVAEAAEPVDDDDLPDWMKDEVPTPVEEETVAEPVAEVTEPADESDLPDWMKDETEAPAAEDKAAEPVAVAEDDPSLAWLDQEVEKQGVAPDETVSEALEPDKAPVSTPAVPPPDAEAEPAGDDDLPDWMKDVDTDAAIADAVDLKVDPELEEFADVEVKEEELAELEAILQGDEVGADIADLEKLFEEDEAEPAAEEELEPAAEAAEDDELPAWLIAEEEKVAEPAAEAAPADDDDLPDWMKDEIPAPAAEEEVAEPAAEAGSADDDDLPDWMKEEAPAPAAEEKAEELEPVAEAAEEDELPAWLTDEPEEAPPLPEAEKPAEPEPVVVEEGDALPAWLESPAEPVDAGLESFLTGEPFPATPLPDLEQITPPEPEAPVEPEPAPVQPVATIPQPEQKATSILPEDEGVPLPAGDTAGVLQSARQQLEEGRRDEALNAYESLVNSGQNVQEVVNDLQTLVDSGRPMYSRVYRVLGDALMASGQMTEALEMYRRALDRI